MQSNQTVERVLQSIAKAERHIKSEYGAMMVGVMDTIGAHPHFVMPLAPGVVKVLSGRPNIDALYKGSVEFTIPQVSRFLTQLATDWFVFVENVPTRHYLADDEMRTIQTVTMFVTDDTDGLSGEFAWERWFPPQVTPADGTIPLPDRAIANLEMHEALTAAICTGDKAVITALLDPGCIWAQRDYLSDAAGGAVTELHGPDAAADHIAKWHAAMRPEHVSMLNRRVADWFVFAEELWTVRPGGGERRQYRTATVYPVNAEGRFEGALGFGLNLEAPSPSADVRRGRGFWS
jgi:hypothetical protein